MYRIIYSRAAIKDIKKLNRSKLAKNALKLIEILKKDPFQEHPPFKQLEGGPKTLYSRRINIQHRMIFEVYEKEKIVKILRMWTHYV